MKWPKTLRVAINVSPVQFAEEDFVKIVQRVLRETRLPPERLELEITESVFVSDDEKVQQIFQRLKDLGVRLALDDFGTGYSSLAYLTRFPFDTIKLDKALVCDQSDKKSVLLRSVVSMARGLDMQVVAEGIQTDQDAADLAMMGCDFGQSYLFGPPLGSESVLRLLKERFPLMKRA